MSRDTDIVIRAEGLGKRYRLGAAAHGPFSYGSLRDTLGRGVHGLWRTVAGRRAEAEKRWLWALKDVAFEVRRGEVLGIIGRNGAGKSTLLKILSRITEPTEGWVDLEGRVGSLLEVGTGFHPELSGRENIFLNGAILGMKRREIKARFDAIVEFAELAKFIDTPVKYYSSGMYMRLAFSVAAHLEPEILLVDEVLAVGDAQFQKKCLGKMGEVARGGRTVLFVSHNMAAVENLCAKCFLLGGGRLIAAGDAQTVIREYMGEPPAQVIDLTARSDRKGSGEIRFAGFVLRDGTGNQVPAFRTGAAAQLEVVFDNRTRQPLSDLQISVGIDGPMGGRVTILSNEMTNQIFASVPAATRSVCIEVPRLPLLPGRYGMTFFARVSGRIADWLENAGSFDVEAGDFFATGRLPEGQGVVAVAHSFRLTPGAPGQAPENALPG